MNQIPKICYSCLYYNKEAFVCPLWAAQGLPVSNLASCPSWASRVKHPKESVAFCRSTKGRPWNSRELDKKIKECRLCVFFETTEEDLNYEDANEEWIESFFPQTGVCKLGMPKVVEDFKCGCFLRKDN